MSLHPKIDPKSLTKTGRLLTHSESEFILQSESFVGSIQEQVQELQQYQQALDNVQELLSIANQPDQYIDQMLVPKQDESADSYRARVLHGLSELLTIIKSNDTKEFVKAVHEAFLLIPKSEELREAYQDCLYQIWSRYEDDGQDIILRGELATQLNTLYDQISHQEDHLKQQIDAFKAQHHVDFELDDNYQLTKISKRSNFLNYSIIYVNNKNDKIPTAFALYRGDDARILGKGGFGKVKLCQNIHTGEWMAAKIQESIMKQPSQAENETLSSFNRFAGESSRQKKYYTIQTLLPGIDLQKYIDQNKHDDVSLRLNIAKKAAELVNEFHCTYLHRDLKPENFIWDDETQELFLCDFGMAAKLGENQDSVNDLSGSGTETYIAPEVNAVHGHVNYTKKSDIYSLGKVFEALFKDIALIPNELNDLINEMTTPDPINRLEKTESILASLQKISDNYRDSDELKRDADSF